MSTNQVVHAAGPTDRSSSFLVVRDQGGRLVINTISNIASLVLRVAGGLLLPPLLLHFLGQNPYGIWALTGSVLAYSSLLSLGLNSAVNRRLPVHFLEGDERAISDVVNTALAANLLAAGLIAVGTVVLALGFPSWFAVSPDLVTVSRITVILVGFGFMTITALNVFHAVLSGLQRYEWIAACDIFADIGRLAGIVIALMSGLGLVAVACMASGANLVRALLKLVVARKRCPGLIINLSLARWTTFADMLGYSVNTLMYTCGQVLQQQAAIILIGATLGISAAAEYAVPWVVAGLIGHVIMAASAAIKPAASHLDAQNKRTHVQELYLRGTKYALLIAIPITAFLVLLGPAFMRLWLRDEYFRSGPTLLSILVVAGLFRGWHMPAFFVVVGLGRHRFFGVLTLVTSGVSVLLGLAAIHWTSWGVAGVAGAFTVPEVLASALLITPYCCRAVGLPVRRELVSSVLPAVVGTIPSLVALVLTTRYWIPESITGLLGVVTIVSVPTLAGWWWLGLGSSERSQFSAVIAKVWSRATHPL